MSLSLQNLHYEELYKLTTSMYFDRSDLRKLWLNCRKSYGIQGHMAYEKPPETGKG